MLLFLLYDGSDFLAKTTDFKEGVKQLSVYCGNNSSFFLKCLSGFDSDDVDGITEIWNTVSHYSEIKNVYEVERKIL